MMFINKIAVYSVEEQELVHDRATYAKALRQVDTGRLILGLTA